jgi:hypothetical protein
LATGAISYVYPAPSQQVIYVDKGRTSTTCTGSAATPAAPPGYTCIYERDADNAYPADRGVDFVTSSGVGLHMAAAAAGDQFWIRGTFAATGP